MTQVNTVLRRAVGYLFEMDFFLMNEYDNMSWLTYGVPDGEFTEDNLPEAKENYREHIWLITNFYGGFEIAKFKEFFETFKGCANRKCYDKNEVISIQTEIAAFIKELEDRGC